MKNTKTLFSTGLVLVIALCASVQIVAMEKQVNPNLTEANKQLLKDRIKYMEYEFNTYNDPKSRHFEQDPKIRERIKARLEANKEMLYGNQPYTTENIRATDQMVYE